MDHDLRCAIEGIVLGLKRAGVVTDDHLSHIAQGINDVACASKSSGTAYRCKDVARQLSRSWGCSQPAL